MPSLREVQSAFSLALFNADDAGVTVMCAGEPERVARALRAYRASVLANLSGALISSYPVLAAIVGADFLSAAIRAYVLERPSHSGNLNDYGQTFDDFLATYGPAAALPYLPAVATLEWRVVQVYAAADAPPQDWSLLAATAPADWGALSFALDPAHAVLSSAWPLARLWEVNQPGYAGDYQVDFDQAHTVLIHRRAGRVLVERLSPSDAALLLALSRTAPLEQAVETLSGDFDLTSTLRRFIENGLLRYAFLETSV